MNESCGNGSPAFAPQWEAEARIRELEELVEAEARVIEWALDRLLKQKGEPRADDRETE